MATWRSRAAAEWTVMRRRPLDWFLLSGSRFAVSAGLLALVAAAIWWTVLSGLAPLAEDTPVLFLLFALISGNVTLITIVVSISQFVLARHLETPGEVREQLREVVGYRQEVSEATGERVIPVTPVGFLLLLYRSIGRDVNALRSRDWADPEADLQRDVEDLFAGLETHVEAILDLLEGREDGIRPALFLALETDYSRYFYGVYRIRAEHGEVLPSAVAADLDRLERHIEQVDVARRYFKTVVIQTELAALSRLLLLIGLPVLVATVVLTLLYTAPAGPAISPRVLATAIPLVVTAGFVPIVLLTAYILRLATVVHRTVAMYPFTNRYD